MKGPSRAVSAFIGPLNSRFTLRQKARKMSQRLQFALGKPPSTPSSWLVRALQQGRAVPDVVAWIGSCLSPCSPTQNNDPLSSTFPFILRRRHHQSSTQSPLGAYSTSGPLFSRAFSKSPAPSASRSSLARSLVRLITSSKNARTGYCDRCPGISCR